MWNWISDNFASLGTVLVAFCSLVLSVFGIKAKGKAPAASNSPKSFAALKVALELLPRFITFSEATNRNATGEEKEAFVLTYIESVYNARGIEFTEEDCNTIKKHIASIVKATKTMHTNSNGEKANETNSRNDIDGVTGLRAISSK